MDVFKITLINETEKLYKKKKLLVAIILSIIIIVLGQFSMLSIRNGFGLRGIGSLEFPLLILSVVTNTILPLFTALVTIDCFSSEFSQNYMKIALTRPVSRFKFFLAKFTAIGIFIFFNLMFIMVFSLATGFVFNLNSFTVNGFIRIFVSYFVTLLPLLIFALLIILFTNIFKSGTAVFFLTILVFILFKALGIFYVQYSGLFFTSLLDWYNLWIMNTFPLSKIIREFLLLTSYGILLFTISYYIFDNKDF